MRMLVIALGDEKGEGREIELVVSEGTDGARAWLAEALTTAANDTASKPGDQDGVRIIAWSPIDPEVS